MAANNDVKRVNWDYDTSDHSIKVGTDSNKAELEEKFVFRLERSKDKATLEESLTIHCTMDGNDNGVVQTAIYDLDSAFDKFMRYGVAFSKIVTFELKAKIQEVYLQLPIKYIEEVNEQDRMTDLLFSVGEYIAAARDKKDTGPFPELLYVPVSEFNEMAKDCGYKDFEIKGLREELKSNGFIRVIGGRYAIVARIKDKPTRAIAFFHDKLNGYIDVEEEKGAEPASQGE